MPAATACPTDRCRTVVCMPTLSGVPNVPRPTVAHVREELRRVVRGDTLTHLLLRNRLAMLLLATLVIDAIATALMFLLEHDNPRSGFDDVGGALFWVSAQLTTISSQLPNPVTTPGRVLDVLIQVWAISVVATVAGSFAAFFHARHDEASAALAGGAESPPTAGASPPRAP